MCRPAPPLEYRSSPAADSEPPRAQPPDADAVEARCNLIRRILKYAEILLTLISELELDVGYIVRQLRAVGADTEITGAGLVLEGSPAHLEMMGNRPATPSDLKRIAETCRSRSTDSTIRPVIVADRASLQASSWLRAHPEVTLVLSDRVFLDGAELLLDDTHPASRSHRGPQPYARFATARVLLTGASRKDQVRLAELAGVSQGSVSNALRRIPETRNPGAAFDELVRDYPGPGGQTYYWWSSRPVDEQSQHLTDQGALISGDFAADLISPWRMPERVVGYVDAPVDLARDGYVLSDAKDYTMMVVVPADPTLRATASTWNSDYLVADPVITAYDVQRTATTGDEDEAIERLRDVVIHRFSGARDG